MTMIPITRAVLVSPNPGAALRGRYPNILFALGISLFVGEPEKRRFVAPRRQRPWECVSLCERPIRARNSSKTGQKMAIRVAAALIALLCAGAIAQPYPAKPVRFIIAQAPGGQN